MNTDALNAMALDLAAYLAGHAPAVVRITHLIYFVCTGLLLAALAWPRSAPAAGRSPRGPALYGAIAFAFAAILLYQATWQLAGFARPEFITFIRTHDRRPVGATGLTRGRIVDGRSRVLAADTADAGGRRSYPLRAAAAHIVGYDSPLFGQSGIEAADDLALSGAGPDALADLKTFGKRMLDHGRSAAPDLRLTIDATLQARALDLLAGRPGAVVGIRPDDGAVVILVSSPAFDPNQLDPARMNRLAHTPMFNRALQGRYAPGSTFKIITACRAAEIGFNGKLDCPASGYTPPGAKRPIRDHEYFEAQRRGSTWRGAGRLDLEAAFARSSNVYFAQLGNRLGAASLNATVLRFGFNRRTVVFRGSSGDVVAEPSNVPDLVRQPARETAQVAIGQGQLAVTPLQMALVTAAIANDGVMMAPRCRVDERPTVLTRATTPAAARRVAALMRGSVVQGTSRGADVADLAIAGKTGTAQKQAGEKDNSWFVCFAPADKPQLALAVLVEGGGYGAQAALPVAVELLRLAAKQDWGEPAASTNAAGGTR